MFKREEYGGRFLGYSLLHKHVFFFFGSKSCSRDDLMGVFPEYEYTFLKQVHGREAVAAGSDVLQEADAHFTNRVTRAPVVQTADCVPVLLASKSQVCAIHAGWRGVALNIIAAAQARLNGERVLFAAIGPHIMRSSFEVGQDVAAQLVAAAPGRDSSRLVFPHNDPSKAYVDLTQIVREQIHSAYGQEIKIFECLHDTFTSPDFHSFRRDGKQAGRQYSFVVLNS